MTADGDSGPSTGGDSEPDADDESVPAWWQPSTADPVARRFYDPTKTVKRVRNTRVETVLKDLSAAAEAAGCRLAPEIETRADGTRVGTGVDDTGLLTRYYRWSVVAREGYVEVTEDRFLAGRWRLLEAGLQGLIATSFLAQYADGVVGLPVGVVIAPLLAVLVLLVCWVGLLTLGARQPPQLAALDGVTQESGSPGLSRVALVTLSGVVAAGSLVSSDLFLLGGAAVALGGTLVSLRYGHRVPPVPDFSVVLPAGGTEYVLTSLVFGVPTGLVVGVATGRLPVEPVLGGLAVAFTGAIACVLAALLALGASDTVDGFRRGGARYVGSTPISLGLVVVGVAVAWASFTFWARAAAFAAALLLGAVGAFDPLAVAVLAVLALLALAPGAYLLVGLVAQAVGSVAGTVRLAAAARRGTAAPTEVGSVVSTPVVVLAAEDPFVGDEDAALARGLWLGPYQRVVVSQGLVDELEAEELRAVVAHEHAHVAEYSDAALGLVVPVAASLLLVGQNVVLSLLDYRQREFRADAFAAERTSPAAVRSAVEQVATLGFDPEEDDGDPPADARRAVGFRAVPGAVPRSGGQSVFTPLFRPFLLSAAHPSVRERRDAVASGDGD